MHVHKNWVLVGMLIPWFDLYQVKDITVFCKPWRAFSVWEKISKDGYGRAGGSLSLFQGSLCKVLVRQDIVGWDSWDTNLGSPVLSLGKPFMLQNSMPSSSKAMVGLPRLRQPVTQETRHTPGVTAEYYKAPKCLAGCPACISLNQREKTDLCGNETQKLRNILELSQMLNPERKRETPGIGPIWVTYIHACLYILTCVYVYVHVFISYFIIYNVQTYNSYPPGGGFKQGLRESEDFAHWALNSVLGNLNRKRPWPFHSCFIEGK